MAHRNQQFVNPSGIRCSANGGLSIANWLIQYLDFSIDSGANICHCAKQIQQ